MERWGGAATSQGAPEDRQQPQAGGKEAGKRLSLTALGGTTLLTLWSQLLISRT